MDINDLLTALEAEGLITIEAEDDDIDGFLETQGLSLDTELPQHD